jgi:GMP synthase-like glutamine amidotransferase
VNRSSILILQHDPDAGPELIADWAKSRGFSTEVLMVPELTEFPSPGDYRWVVPLGSERCAADTEVDWIQAEASFLAGAHDSGTPVFGICFGAQLLAMALGGDVLPGTAAEVGWRDLEVDGPAPYSGRWFQWHFDTFVVPGKAELLGQSEVGPEVFRQGDSVGVQFHPEVTLALIQRWLAVDGASLVQRGIDPELVLAGTPPSETVRRRAFRLFDEIMS